MCNEADAGYFKILSTDPQELEFLVLRCPRMAKQKVGNPK